MTRPRLRAAGFSGVAARRNFFGEPFRFYGAEPPCRHAVADYEAQSAALPVGRRAALPHFSADFIPRRFRDFRAARTPRSVCPVRRARTAPARGRPRARPAGGGFGGFGGIRPGASWLPQKLPWFVTAPARLQSASPTSPHWCARRAAVRPGLSCLLSVLSTRTRPRVRQTLTCGALGVASVHAPRVRAPAGAFLAAPLAARAPAGSSDPFSVSGFCPLCSDFLASLRDFFPFFIGFHGQSCV